MRQKRRHHGYTLIELLIVIVIVSILSTVSLRTYADLADESKMAGARGVAGALGSASAANFMLRNKGPAGTIAISDCADNAGLLMPGSLQSFVITPKPIAPGATEFCTVDHIKPGAATAVTFTAYGIS